MRLRLRRQREEPDASIEELCCEEQRMLEAWDRGGDPWREGVAEARLERACTHLREPAHGDAAGRDRPAGG